MRVIQGFFTGTPAAASALVAVDAPKKRLAYSLGLVQTAVFVGSSLGPMLGGYVADAWGYRSTFFTSAVLAGVSLMVVISFVREPASSQEVSRARESIVTGFRNLLTAGPLLSLTVMVLFMNMAFNLLGPVLPLTIQRLVINPSRLASTAGTISGVFAFTAAVAALVVGRISDKIGYATTVIVCAFGMALLYFPQGFVPTVLLLGVLRTVQGFFQGGLAPSINALVVNAAPLHKAGATIGISSSAASVGTAVGPVIGALLLNRTSDTVAFLTSGAMFLVISFVVLLRQWRGGFTADDQRV